LNEVFDAALQKEYLKEQAITASIELKKKESI
jgi:Lon-like ATP-dependent protease